MVHYFKRTPGFPGETIMEMDSGPLEDDFPLPRGGELHLHDCWEGTFF